MARAIAAFKIDVEGADQLARKLNPDSLYEDPLRRLLDEARKVGEQKAHERAPRGITGRLDAGIDSELKPNAVPMHAIVSVEAIARDGFRYPFALDTSPKFHYRAGALRTTRRGRTGLVRGGKPTKGWFTKVLPLVRSHLSRARKKTLAEIEQRFTSR